MQKRGCLFIFWKDCTVVKKTFFFCIPKDSLLEKLHHKALLHERPKSRTCKACGEWGPLYENDVAQFHRYSFWLSLSSTRYIFSIFLAREGVVLLREVLTPQQVELCFDEVVNRFNAVTTAITHMGLEDVLQRDGFQEFKMRNLGR